MNTDEHGLKYADLTSRIIDVFFSVYNELGPGFLESVHVEALGGIRPDWTGIQRDAALKVFFRGRG
jgi:hypothetical protein